MKTVQLSAGAWRVGQVGLAETFSDRLLGIRHAKAANGVVMPTTRLHTFGLTAPIVAVSLDDELRVVETRVVPPNRMVWFRRARSVLELEMRLAPPEVGDTVEIIDG